VVFGLSRQGGFEILTELYRLRIANARRKGWAMSDRLITVATFQEPVAAALARNYLDAQGIPAMLIDETTIATDWMLAGAIGGIKLQVYPIHLERAELLLAQIEEDRTTDEHPAADPTAVASQEVAEDLKAEREDRAPINLLVERMFRATVFGLIFPPLQVYSIYLVFELMLTEGKVSEGRRWKVWASVLLSLPVIGGILMTLACIGGMV
jgi:hypothetical protein